MTDHAMPDEMPSARDQAAREIKRVLGQEMMSRRFIDAPPQCHVLQSGVLLVFIGVLLLMLVQQVVSTDPAMQIAHQQRGAPSTTGSVGSPGRSDRLHLPLERNDP